MQKGERVKGASPELKKVAKTMNKKDARDFASTKHAGLPSKVTEGVMLEAGSAIEHIISKFKHETKNFIAGEELDRDLFEALFDYYSDNGEMPYGVAKARDGDPYQWIENHFEKDLEIMGYPRDFNAPNNLAHDHELADLARLAGLTNEDGPGSAMLYSKDKPESFGDKLKSVGKSVRQAIDKATLPSAMHADYDRIEANKDRVSAANRTASEPKDPGFLGAATGSTSAAAADRPIDLPSYSGKLKEDEELNQMRRIAGLKEAQPQSPGAAPTHAARERERVVSPKVDKFDKEKEAAEKGRRDIIDRESPDANSFGRKIGKAVATPIAAVKSAWHGATDAWDHEMGNDTYPDPKPPVSVVKKNDWKGDKDNPALKECGDMGMESQQDSLNVSTNMSSDGTKSVTVSAQGDQASALIDMLRLAGMNSNHVAHDHEPEIVMVSSDDEEMMDEGEVPIQQIPPVAPNPSEKTWSYVQQPGGKAGADAHGSRVTPKAPGALEEDEIDEAKRSRITKYSNTPDEEYETVDAITRQGNDLNREKRQFAGKPRLGDNPMAESLLDADLDAMLESILIREEDSAAKKVGDAVKNPSDAAKDVGDKVKGRLSFTKDAEGKTSVQSSTGRIKATIDGNKTHYEPGEPLDKEKTDEGVLDDVSDFVGGVLGTENYYKKHSQQLQDLDAMRNQYKGTPYEKQVNDRYTKHLDRLQLDKGEVVDKKGEPIKVLPPDQWKGSN
jgi:hypothetical protein